MEAVQGVLVVVALIGSGAAAYLAWDQRRRGRTGRHVWALALGAVGFLVAAGANLLALLTG